MNQKMVMAIGLPNSLVFWVFSGFSNGLHVAFRKTHQVPDSPWHGRACSRVRYQETRRAASRFRVD